MPRPKPLRHDDARRVVALARSLDYPIAAIDVRTDGVTVHIAQPEAKVENAFDAWATQQGQSDERPARRRQ